MIKANVLGIVLLLVSCSIFLVSPVQAGLNGSRSVIAVTGCMILNNASAPYVQTVDIVSSSTDPCIQIVSTNVKFNGNNHSITNVAGDISQSIKVNASYATIQNVRIYNSGYGILVSRFTDPNPITGTVINYVYFENNTWGIYLNQDEHEAVIKTSTFKNNQIGILAQASKNLIIANSTFENNPIGILLDGRNGIGTLSDSIVSNVSISQSKNGLRILTTSNFWFRNNSLQNVRIYKTKKGGLDINVSIPSTSFTNDSMLIFEDNLIDSYAFLFQGGPMTFKNANGAIKFLEAINGSGTQLSNRITIANNLSSIDATENNGLNRSALITLHHIIFSNMTIQVYRNGLACTSCNLIAWNAPENTPVFNVTGEGVYSVAP